MEVTDVVRLAEHIGFAYDGSPESLHVTKAMSEVNASFIISEPENWRYAQFRRSAREWLPEKAPKVDGIVDLRYFNDEIGMYRDPTYADYGEVLHGIIEARNGTIALFDGEQHSGLPQHLVTFTTVNGPGGANESHAKLGRVPGTDIPKWVPFEKHTGQVYAGEITEALASMQMLAPGINNFPFAEHDLSVTPSSHGRSWPHTHPAFYKHLSRIAQDTVVQYGDRIHFSNQYERDKRPGVVIDIAKALDDLQGMLAPAIRNCSTVERLIRNDRETISTSDYAFILSSLGVERPYNGEPASLWAGEVWQDKDTVAYWRKVQLLSGLLQTRITLHEVAPHPEATPQQTRKTLDVLLTVKKQADRRIADNREFALAE